MPLVAHTDLPTFKRLQEEGEEILTPERAKHQDIRELHIGLLNMMPDAALEATERQFLRLLGACNQIVQLHVHLFTIAGIERDVKAQAHLLRYYESFDKIKQSGLDGLIISGTNVIHSNLEQEAFWQPLGEVFSWAKQNVTSILCSCLATHALIQYCYGLKRTHLVRKRWGIFSHQVINHKHPLVAEINTKFDVPHSRVNEIFQQDLAKIGIKVLVYSEQAGAHLFVSPDGFRVVFFQGHPEYDSISLLKEYKREVELFYHKKIQQYPPFPEHYLGVAGKKILVNYKVHIKNAQQHNIVADDFPEQELVALLDNTWRDSTKAIFNNWLGKIYQITNQDRRMPFMQGINPDNPLNL